MKPKIIQKEGLLLAGFSFFGNPFEEKDPWSEENEIGKLWRRLMTFIQQNASAVDRLAAQKDVFYEVHLSHPDTQVTGEFEVFVGLAVSSPTDVPVEWVVKVLPPSQYAVFTLVGEQINQDWPQMIYQEWLPQEGYAAAYPFNFQYYDHRFKGMDRLVDSVIDVYVPIQKLPV